MLRKLACFLANDLVDSAKSRLGALDAEVVMPGRAAQGILISPRMVEDHSCMTLQKALQLAQQLPKLGLSPFEAVDYLPPPPVPQNAEVSSEAKQGQPDTSTGKDMV